MNFNLLDDLSKRSRIYLWYIYESGFLCREFGIIMKIFFRRMVRINNLFDLDIILNFYNLFM